MPQRFARTELLLGADALSTLSQARVAVFGIGGVGSYAAESLARSGIGALDLIDHDRVSPTNINRQIVALDSTLGLYKVDVMAKRIADINPACRVTPHRCFYLPDTQDEIPLDQFDYIIDAVDTVTAKLLLAQNAQAAGVPIISSMGSANKLDPTCLRVADISQTRICPLAKIIRKECRKRGIEHLKVVYSEEPATQPSEAAQAAYREKVEQIEQAAQAEQASLIEQAAQAHCGEHAVGAASEFDGPAEVAKLPQTPVSDKFGRAGIPGSTAFVPPVAGFILASEVVKDLISQ